jgi:hypothetical protein
VLALLAVCYLLAAPVARARTAPTHPSPSFVEGALCVHSGWHYTRHRPHRGARPDYWLWGHGFWRTSDVPDYLAGGSGEGGWTGVVGSLYGGGMSFMVGTYNRAAGLTHGTVAYVSSTYGIAARPPREQLLATWLIVQQDGGSWGEWPQTSRACGLR